MHLVPEVVRDDRLMLAGIGSSLVDGITEIDPVVEELVEIALVDPPAVAHRDALLINWVMSLAMQSIHPSL